MKTSIILVAAGKGSRFGQSKLFVELAGKSLLEWNLDLISQLRFVDELLIISPSQEKKKIIKILERYSLPNTKIITGGRERVDSVSNGLAACTSDIVLIHNVANPLASKEDFEILHRELLKKDCACFVGQRAVDTLRKLDGNMTQTIDRKDVWRVQTPQGFHKESLLAVIDNYEGAEITDEIMFFEGSEMPILGFPTSLHNQKITYPKDISLFESFLKSDNLYGIGEDSHAFDSEGTLTLAGVEVSDFPKLKGNSDGDLISHALFNAISSALGKASISKTADPMCQRGITNSLEYLREILHSTKARGLHINNISISLECSRPKIEPLVDRMKESLSKVCEIDKNSIGITATSGEGLSSFGRGEGIRCSCVVSLQ